MTGLCVCACVCGGSGGSGKGRVARGFKIEREAEKEGESGGMRWNEKANEGGRQMRVRKRDGGVER